MKRDRSLGKEEEIGGREGGRERGRGDGEEDHSILQ